MFSRILECDGAAEIARHQRRVQDLVDEVGRNAVNVAVFLLWEPTFGSQQEQQNFFFCHAEIPWEISHQEPLADGGRPAAEEIVKQLDPSATIEDARGFLHLNRLAEVFFEVIEQRPQSFKRALLSLEGLYGPGI